MKKLKDTLGLSNHTIPTSFRKSIFIHLNSQILAKNLHLINNYIQLICTVIVHCRFTFYENIYMNMTITRIYIWIWPYSTVMKLWAGRLRYWMQYWTQVTFCNALPRNVLMKIVQSKVTKQVGTGTGVFAVLQYFEPFERPFKAFWSILKAFQCILKVF